eukprot:m.93855 g.93855  ORF g.93855 m.93855 type:complete len:81 (+) comp16541_c0_seq9:2018-2260(+)
MVVSAFCCILSTLLRSASFATNAASSASASTAALLDVRFSIACHWLDLRACEEWRDAHRQHTTGDADTRHNQTDTPTWHT